MLRSLLTLWLTVGGVIACTNCASTRTADPDVPTPVPIQADLTLFTPRGFGRGCPVDGYIYTARHVVQPTEKGEITDARWGDRLGRSGYAKTMNVSGNADAAVLQPQGLSPLMLTLGDITEDVYFYQYATSGSPFHSVLVRAKILSHTADHAALSKLPAFGASGGCLFNEHGRPIGIIVWGLYETWGVAALFPR